MAADAMRRATGLRHDALQVRFMCSRPQRDHLALFMASVHPRFAPLVVGADGEVCDYARPDAMLSDR